MRLLGNTIFLGELSLNGDVKKVNGVLPILISAKENGYTDFIIPYENTKEASFIAGITVHTVKNLSELVKYYNNETILEKVESIDSSKYIIQK